MIIPSGSLAVFALNALQNSMMLTPCGPSAVPTGGAGVALPAGICSFTEPVTFFAITKPSLQSLSPRSRLGLYPESQPATAAPYFAGAIAGSITAHSPKHGENTLRCLFHLQEIQLHRSRPAKNRNQHAQRIALRIDLVHLALEVRERSIDNADQLALLERHLRARTFRSRRLTIEHLVDLIRAQRNGRLSAAHEPRDPRRIFHAMPQLVVHFHLHHDVARIQQP